MTAGTLTPHQLRTFNELLAVGGGRPVFPSGLAEELAARLRVRTDPAVAAWTERSLWVSKANLSTTHRCEGQLLAESSAPRAVKSLHPATAVGIVTHRAIQIAHTHPGRAVPTYVNAALVGATQETEFGQFWQEADIGVQSDLTMQMVSRVTAFLDSWPPLAPGWTPRFEESMQAKLGRLTIGARVDLVLGRPLADGRQTMLLCDLKSGALQPYHEQEAMLYALVSTLRWGVAPFRSIVYSLASGTYTDPDVTPARLLEAADWVALGVERLVAVRTERSAPELRPGVHCNWCPARKTCSAATADDGTVVSLV